MSFSNLTPSMAVPLVEPRSADLPLAIHKSDLSVMPGDKFTTSEFREYSFAPSEPAFFDIECHIFTLQGQQGIEYLVEINFFQWLGGILLERPYPSALESQMV